MMVRKPDDEGFGLVEVVIAFFLLAVIAIVMLPGLWKGLGYSAQQSTTATATRQLNAIVEGLRSQSTPGACSDVTTYVSSLPTVNDGRSRPVVASVSSCSTGVGTLSVTLIARVNAAQVATVSAFLYSPTATPTP